MRSPRSATPTRTASAAEHDDERAGARECPPDRELDPVGEVADELSGAARECRGDVALAARQRVQRDECERHGEDRRRDCRHRARGQPDVVQAQCEHGEPGREHEQTAAVGAEAVAPDGDECEAGHRQGCPAEQRRAEQRGHEEHRPEQVVDPVEAARLGGAERRERHRLRVEAERHEVRGQDRRAGGPEGEQHHRGNRSEGEPRETGAGWPPAPRAARGERVAGARRRARTSAAARRSVSGRRSASLRSIRSSSRSRAATGSRRRSRAQPPRRHVRDRDEAVDAGRVGGEQALGAEQGDRVAAVVVATALGRQGDEDHGTARRVQLDQVLSFGDAAEQVVLQISAQESRERARACHLGTGARDEPPERCFVRVPLELERRHDAHAGAGGSGGEEQRQH